MGTVVRSIMPAAVARKAGKRSVSKAKKVKNVGLKRTKGDVKKSHAPSKPVSRSASYKRRGVWAVKKKNGGKLPVHKKAAAPAKKEVVPRFYASEDIPVPFTRRNVAKPAKLRASITPGTVLILLRPLPGEARRVPEAAGIWAAPCHRALQDQRCAPSPRQPGVLHCHLHQGGHHGGQRRQDRRRVLRQGEDDGGQECRWVLQDRWCQGGAERGTQGRPEGSRHGAAGHDQEDGVPQGLPQRQVLA